MDGGLGCEDSSDLGDEHIDLNDVARSEVEQSGVWESAAALLRCEPGNFGDELNSKNSFEYIRTARLVHHSDREFIHPLVGAAELGTDTMAAGGDTLVRRASVRHASGRSG